jgi:hypothetical protein
MIRKAKNAKIEEDSPEAPPPAPTTNKQQED